MAADELGPSFRGLVETRTPGATGGPGKPAVSNHGRMSGPPQSDTPSHAEADGNRTRRAEVLDATSFEDWEGHQAPSRLRLEL